MPEEKPTPESQEKHGRTWPDFLAAFPVWLIAVSLFSFAALAVYASFVKREKVSFGFLGEFGPVSPVEQSNIPSGAVISFDRNIFTESACPKGWTLFAPAGGRFIVGAGDHSNHDLDGNKISEYNLGDFGGRETATLAEGHLPKHKHVTQVGVLAGNDIWGHGGESEKSVHGARIGTANLAFSDYAGYETPTPLQVRPPFIPLYFCKFN